MQIKLSNEVIEADITKEGTLLTENEPKKLRITRNNFVKSQPKIECAEDDEIKTDLPLNVQSVKLISNQGSKDAPVSRKRKLVKNISPESDDSSTTTKRRCKTKGGVNKNSITIRKQTNNKNRKKVIKSKKSPAFEQTVSCEPPHTSPRKVTELRNKKSFNFEVTISGDSPPPPPRGPEPSASSPPPREPEHCAPSPSPCPSWTRDISSSSAVTCLTVRTDDIVRIDNKLPLLRLTDVARAPRPAPRPPSRPARTPSPSPSTSSNSTSTSSTSCSSATCSLARSSADPHDDDIDRALQKLTTEFKKKDVEMFDLVVCENINDSSALRNFRKRVCKALAEESEVIAHCNALKKLLIHDYEDLFSDIDPCENQEVDRLPDKQFIKPRDVRKSTRCDTATEPGSKMVCDDRGSAGRLEESAPASAPTSAPASAPPGTAPCEERGNDDDDALSLFAESITCLDSSRRHDSQPGDFAEYVPRPINANKKSETIAYRPSHIDRNQTAKIVCEKQNADSTSMYRETRNYYENTSDVGVEDESSWPWAGASRATAGPPAPFLTPAPAVELGPEEAGRPLFIADIYPEPKNLKSFVFMGVCFYNLASKCKRECCQFLHAELPPGVVSARLSRLDCDAAFAHEYMIMRNWAELRRRYGLAYVLEGARRGLTRLLLEMAIDFAGRADPEHPEDKALTVKVLEAIMLYLNTIDVREYGDFLEFPAPGGRPLCDIFMETLAGTQNFSRFKSIFVNLTEFMERISRPFEFEVASSLLERVCILPHEERTAAAMLIVLRRSSPRVLRNGMIGLFERRVAADERLARDFEALKRAAGGRSFSPDTTGAAPDCASAVATNAIDSHLAESFRKVGSVIRPGWKRSAGRRGGWFGAPGRLRGAAAHITPPRPLFRFPRSRPFQNYQKRFMQDS
ncbi:PREDICTED: uncharacterized protein LOC106117751 [Papilio xuthus]|uniref:Uncharacterized protein LOC106117751 n=1 Tax=Papilio xuthus TaxID=66420 RepID=A0AAJ6Z956_PAPXU|nr:PREDICTED: uncharacterized protein LOC106117751 [Papilio xuthus]